MSGAWKWTDNEHGRVLVTDQYDERGGIVARSRETVLRADSEHDAEGCQYTLRISDEHQLMLAAAPLMLDALIGLLRCEDMMAWRGALDNVRRALAAAGEPLCESLGCVEGAVAGGCEDCHALRCADHLYVVSAGGAPPEPKRVCHGCERKVVAA